jgi:hypothetical protein
MPAEGSSTATQHSPKCLQLLIAENGLEAFQKLSALGTDDVGHFDGRPLMNDVADDRRDYTGRRWPASALRSGWRPCAGAAGQMQIPGCHLQIFMAEQKLDGAQVGAGFK